MALASGKLGWCKASRLVYVAAPDNEVMWLESVLSLTVQQLERRIKDGTDTLASTLHLPLTEDRRVLWENALEIYRRRAGAEISPVEAFELMIAEVIAEWGGYLTDTDPPVSEPEPEIPSDNRSEAGPVFPWIEAIDTHSIGHIVQPSLFESELAAEAAFEKNPDYKQIRLFVLERDRLEM